MEETATVCRGFSAHGWRGVGCLAGLDVSAEPADEGLDVVVLEVFEAQFPPERQCGLVGGVDVKDAARDALLLHGLGAAFDQFPSDTPASVVGVDGEMVDAGPSAVVSAEDGCDESAGLPGDETAPRVPPEIALDGFSRITAFGVDVYALRLLPESNDFVVVLDRHVFNHAGHG